MTSNVCGTYKQLPFWRLRALFRECGMYDFEVSQASGISQPTLNRRMNGYKPWTADEIIALCRLFNIPQEQVGYYFFPELGKETNNA